MSQHDSSARARTFRRRTAAAFAAVGALLLSSGMVMVTASAASADTTVGVCHATGSDKEPFNFVSVDTNSADYQGHLAHKDDPQQIWHKRTLWNGAWHEAGSAKPDIVGTLGAPVTEELCNLPGSHEVKVTPGVDFTDPRCANSNNPSWVGAELDKVTYSLTAGTVAPGQSVVVSATPKLGYVFPKNADTSFSWTFGPVEFCGGEDGVNPVAPEVVQPRCTGPGTSTGLSVTLPQSHDGVTYSFDEATLTVTATATGEPFATDLPTGWVRVSDTTATYLVTLRPAGACLETVSAEAPSATDNTCTTPGHLVLPSEEGDGYHWAGQTDDTPGDHALTAVADQGYQLTGQTQWTVHVKAAGEGRTCGGGENPGDPVDPVDPQATVVEPAYPSAGAATCSRDGKLMVPAQPEGVLMTQSGTVPGDVTFTFAPAEGYVFPEGTVTEVVVSVPAMLTGGDCILGEEETKQPKPKPNNDDKKPVVLGTQAAVPTAVDAGLADWTHQTASSTTSGPKLAQALVAGGLLMLVAGGWLGLGRRTRGAHES